MDTSQNKCRVGIMRQSKAALSARAFNIYVDGIKTTALRNGETTRLVISPGSHVIGFGIGTKIISSLTLSLAPGDDANLMCYVKGSKIEAVATSVDVCSLANEKSPVQAQSSPGGCLVSLILFLIGMSILGFGVRFFVYLVPVS